MTLVSKVDAKAAHLKRYFTGIPCKYGHVSERLTSGGQCLACHRTLTAASYKRRKAAGADVHAGSRRFRARHPERVRHIQKRWRQNNAEYCAQRMAKWEKENKAKRQEIWRRRSANNRDRINAKARAWYQENKDRRKGRSRFRKAAKISATPSWADRRELDRIYAECPSGMHVDHIIPLRHPDVCGLHVPYNLQYLSARDNLVKGNRL